MKECRVCILIFTTEIKFKQSMKTFTRKTDYYVNLQNAYFLLNWLKLMGRPA